MKGLNLSSFKKIKEDKHSATMMHNDGHTLLIAKHSLPAIQKKQLEKLPIHNVQMLADGTHDGPVQAPDEVDRTINDIAGSPEENQKGYEAALKTLPGTAQNTPQEPEQPDTNAQALALSNAAAQSAIDNQAQETPASQAPSAPQPVGSDVVGAYNQGQKAIGEQADINAKLSKAQEAIGKDDLDARQDLADTVTDDHDSFKEDQQKLISDFAAQHINPNHYQENMSTPQKVATGIGLLLGGLGSAYTGQGNPASDWLHKQIDRDIAGQQSRMDQTKTLLGANQELYHDNVIANNQTRVNLNDIYNHKIQQSAAALGTPQAKANADAQSSKFALENAGLLQQNAIRSTVMKSISSNGGKGLTAPDLVTAGYIPKEFADQAYKEQASIDSQKQSIGAALNLMNNFSKEQTLGNLANPQSAKRVGALNGELTNLILSSDASKRLTQESAEREIEPFKVKTSDDAKTYLAKTQGILNLIQKHAEPTPLMREKAPGSLPSYDLNSYQSKSPNEGKTGTFADGSRGVIKNGVPVRLGK